MSRAGDRRALLHDRVMATLARIPDPEIPVIGLIDLGVIAGVDVGDAGDVVVRLMPTFVGCPALHLMKERIAADVGALEGVRSVEVRVVLDPPWTTDRISEQGLRRLREWGLTPPRPPGGVSRGDLVPCPYCGSRNTRLENAFGPTPCRAIHYCDDCRQPFERFKELV